MEKISYSFFDSDFVYLNQEALPKIHVVNFIKSFKHQDLTNFVKEIRDIITNQAQVFSVKIEELKPLYIDLKSGGGRSMFKPYLNRIEFKENH